MRRQVLIVEDNRALAENIADLFDDEGIRAEVCGTGAQALAATLTDPPDLAIVDVRLPDTTGVALLPQLRKQMPGSEVILMTGDASLDTAIEAVRMGVFAYVQKPFAAQDLTALAARALEQVRLRRDREQLATQLAVSERLYRGVVEAVESMIVGVDGMGAIRMWSRFAGTVTGWDPGEAQGRDFVEFIVASDLRDTARELLAEAWRRRRLYDVECAILDRTGQRREVRWNMVSFIPDGDTLELLLLVGTDVTQRLALEKRAADAEAMASLATLTASLAHEIRNPLNAAILQLELLGRHAGRLPEGVARDKIGQCSRLVTSEIQRLSKLLEEFLGLARPRSLERYPIDVPGLCEYVATMQRPQAEAHGVEIHLHTPADLPRVLGDQPKLTQVLVNLVVNAIDAMRGMDSPPSPATIDISAAAVDGRVRITVADRGPGIDAKLASKVFTAFFSTKESGTGLGLAIVKRIIDLHGGTIELRPRAGGGTLACVTLQPVGVVPESTESA
jgi:PAS domain S-box-containing protein